MTASWWNGADVVRAADNARRDARHLRPHRWHSPMLGEGRNRLLALGLIHAKPMLVKGQPTGWIISVTPFGQAVREALTGGKQPQPTAQPLTVDQVVEWVNRVVDLVDLQKVAHAIGARVRGVSDEVEAIGVAS